MCEIDINECNLTSIDGKAPCENGECINLEGSYECNCTGTGYRGETLNLFWSIYMTALFVSKIVFSAKSVSYRTNFSFVKSQP